MNKITTPEHLSEAKLALYYSFPKFKQVIDNTDLTKTTVQYELARSTLSLDVPEKNLQYLLNSINDPDLRSYGNYYHFSDAMSVMGLIRGKRIVREYWTELLIILMVNKPPALADLVYAMKHLPSLSFTVAKKYLLGNPSTESIYYAVMCEDYNTTKLFINAGFKISQESIILAIQKNNIILAKLLMNNSAFSIENINSKPSAIDVEFALHYIFPKFKRVMDANTGLTTIQKYELAYSSLSMDVPEKNLKYMLDSLGEPDLCYGNYYDVSIHEIPERLLLGSDIKAKYWNELVENLIVFKTPSLADVVYIMNHLPKQSKIAAKEYVKDDPSADCIPAAFGCNNYAVVKIFINAGIKAPTGLAICAIHQNNIPMARLLLRNPLVRY